MPKYLAVVNNIIKLFFWGAGVKRSNWHSFLIDLSVLESLIKFIQLILERIGDRNNDNLLVVYNCPKVKED